jgi:hypothetical protein
MNTSRTDEQPLEQDLTTAWRCRRPILPAALCGDEDRYRCRPQPPRYDFAGLTLVCYLIFCIAGAACWLWMALEPVFEHVERMLR